MLDRSAVIRLFTTVRQRSETLCETLQPEDFVIQTMEDVSPAKWHIAHTSWFFEQVILHTYESNFAPVNETYFWLFNSYYESFGGRIVRSDRGTISRPTIPEVMSYRTAVTERMLKLLESCDDASWETVRNLTILGCHHEEQHQELFLTDIKHVFAASPLYPALVIRNSTTAATSPPATKMISFSGGTKSVGHEGGGFSWDNEHPRHDQLVADFKLANHPVTNREWLAFIDDGGYSDHRYWLSDGWAWVQENQIIAPLYWHREDDQWMTMTLSGRMPIDLNEPVAHISYYEAWAYARWAGKRLPTEFEWETAAAAQGDRCQCGTMMDDRIYHPVAKAHDSADESTLHSLFGDVWEWTNSAYLPYPGYRQAADALGEYNGKFMSGQMVLRGGSCATPRAHIRSTYRNFFQPEKRWQFTGLRLADDD